MEYLDIESALWCLLTILALIMHCAMQAVLKKDLKFYLYSLLEFMAYGNVIMISWPTCWCVMLEVVCVCIPFVLIRPALMISLIWFFGLQFSFSLCMFLFRISKVDDSFARRFKFTSYCMQANGTGCFCCQDYIANYWRRKKLSFAHNLLFIVWITWHFLFKIPS